MFNTFKPLPSIVLQKIMRPSNCATGLVNEKGWYMWQQKELALLSEISEKQRSIEK
jgi:hypothetical protein